MLEIEKSAAYPSDAIAVVGMALRVPGASDPDALWCMLKNGECSVSKRGKSMDPQQRLLLHVAFEALQDAGYVPGATPSFEAASFGVFVGAATHDYVHNLQNDVDSYYSTGTLSAFLSGRISYAFSFGGPSVVTNTACSSSCVALHQAVRSLLNEDCRTALAGGVNVITSPEMHTGLDAARFLTQNHDSSPFDANPSGYSRAEGCVLFVLKRAKDALNENDRILGIIRGAELNQSGQASSITRTHAPAQADLLRKLLRKAGVQPKEIRVVECHAAGTRVGDTSEVLAIREVFQRDLVGHEDEADPLYLTSVKANFGHLEAASGALSVAKAILMFRHFCIPPQVRITQMNSAITHPPSRFIRVPQAPVKWPGDKGPRYVIVNNYGAAGSNAGILLQAPLLIRQSIPNSQDSQATNSNHHPQCVVPRSHLNKNASFIKTESNSGSLPSITSIFSLSASTPERLAAWRDKVVEWFQREPDAHREAQGCFDIAYTTTARRQIYDYRIAFPFVFAKGGNSARNATSDSPDDAASSTLLDKLRSAPIEKSSLRDSRVVFVFPGQGCQYPGMGAHLYHTSSSFREDLNRCGEIASTLVDEGGSVVEQLALLSFEYAMTRLGFGGVLGEYVVLVVAGVLTIEDAVKLVIARARLVRDLCGPCHPDASTRQEPDVTASGMLAIYGVSSSSLHRLFDDHHPRFASITKNLTLSGPLYQLHQLHSLIKSERGITRACFVRVAVGYHSPFMSPILGGLAQVLDDIKLRPPTVAIASTVIGRVIPAGDTFCMRTYLSEHTIKPVVLHLAALSAIDHLDRDLTSLEGHPHGASLQLNPCVVLNNPQVWIEVGPHENLIHLLLGQDCLYRTIPYGWGPCRKSKAKGLGLQPSTRSSMTRWARGERRHQLSIYAFSELQLCRKLGRPRRFDTLAGRPPGALRTFGSSSPAIDNDWTSSFHIPGHVVRGLPLCPALAGVFAAHRCLEGHEPPSVTLSTITFVNALLPGSDHTCPIAVPWDPLEAGIPSNRPPLCTRTAVSVPRHASPLIVSSLPSSPTSVMPSAQMSTSFRPIFRVPALQRVVVDSSRMAGMLVGHPPGPHRCHPALRWFSLAISQRSAMKCTYAQGWKAPTSFHACTIADVTVILLGQSSTPRPLLRMPRAHELACPVRLRRRPPPMNQRPHRQYPRSRFGAQAHFPRLPHLPGIETSLRNLLSNTLHIAGYRFGRDLNLSSWGMLDSVEHGLPLPSTFFHQFSTIARRRWICIQQTTSSGRTPLSLSCLGRLMIACYSKWIQELGYESIILGGWSFGGIVAFEVASMLLSVRPAFVEAVLLVDSPCPSIDYALDSTGLAMTSRCALKLRFLENVHLLQLPIHISALPSGVAHGLHSWFTSRNDLEVLANSWRVFAGPFSTVEASVLQGNHFNVFIDAKIVSTANAIVAAIESVTGSA
ncbi:hypothetical protein BKA70DRAFT_1323705 [Coprinopsis sp. MPI-PUGE-AT-0042]|nr:hypothetical protein BKA70DRAFT_1323705 [Coprinopsis sp. MPI-PUGE-AT-0042]